VDGFTHDRRVCHSDIRAHTPDWMAEGVTHGSGQVTFSDMPRDQYRVRESKQRSANLSSTQYRGNSSDGRQVVSDDRTPSVERVEVLCPVLSCELSI
jgi:hypothetical protein